MTTRKFIVEIEGEKMDDWEERLVVIIGCGIAIEIIICLALIIVLFK